MIWTACWASPIGGQLQVIIGKDLLKVYEEVLKLGYSDGGAVDENWTVT